MAAIQVATSSHLQTFEDGAKFLRIPIFFLYLYAKYSKQFLYYNHWC